MLDAMRRGVANLFTKILLGLLIIAFAVWGVGDYIVSGPTPSTALATVGGTDISPDEFRQAYQAEMQSIARKLGHTLTPEQAKLLGLPPRTLARLIGRAAIDHHASDLGVRVADTIISGSIMADPAFKGFDGKFSRTKLRQVFVQEGYRSEEQYIDARRRDLWRQQLTEALGAGAVPQQFLVEALHRFRDETRVFEYIVPDLAKRVTVAEATDEKLQAFFEKNKQKYVAPEERKANLLLLTREEALARANVTDAEIEAAYEEAKASYDVPEKRRISQLTFADKAAAEKAYAELSKAQNFDEAAAKLGFPAADTQLGLLTRGKMIDPKIAEAAFGLELNELSQPVQGQFSVVLLRVTEIEAGKKRTLDEVKGEIRDRIAQDRIAQQVQALHEKVEDARASGTPLKEIAAKVNLPFQEIAAITRDGKTPDGKPAITHADAKRITDAIFEALAGVETEVLELSDGGLAWFVLVGVTPQRQRDFKDLQAQVRADFTAEELRAAMAKLAEAQVERLQKGEALEEVAKALGAKVERTAAVKRTANPPPTGFTAVALQQAFTLAKGAAASAQTPDGAARIIFRVAEVVAAPPPTPEQATALKAELTNQLRIDLLDQYVAGLRTRYGFTVNEKAVLKTLGISETAEGDG